MKITKEDLRVGDIFYLGDHSGSKFVILRVDLEKGKCDWQWTHKTLDRQNFQSSEAVRDADISIIVSGYHVASRAPNPAMVVLRPPRRRGIEL